MNIGEARSYSDGIDFYVHNKNISISVKRNSDGDIVVKKHNTINQIEKVQQSPLLKLVLIIISVLFSLIFPYCNNYKIKIMAILSLIWIFTITYYFINSKNPNKFMLFKYHAAEHKALNYMHKYGKATQDCSEIMNMPSISISCGSTIIVVVYVLISLLAIGILFIPSFILNFVWIIISIFITLYLWAYGKCDFLQKLVLKDPGYDEVELATRGLWEYMNMKDE